MQELPADAAYARPAIAVYAMADSSSRWPADDNRTALERHGKLRVPVLAIGGEMSTSGPLMEAMMKEVASDVRGCVFPGTAHWIPEERPSALTEQLVTFLRGAYGTATPAGE